MPRIENDIKLDFKDVLLRPKRSTLKSRSEVDLMRSFTFRNSKGSYRGIPIIAANMDTVGTFEMAVALHSFSLFTAVHKHYCVDDWKEFAAKHPECLESVAVSTGTGENDFERLAAILAAVPQIQYVCVDVANGYSEHFVHFVKDVRQKFPSHTIMAGNVVTGEMVEELILAGADIIKVGIGPGSVCTTRKKTGVGYPQLSAVIECADAAHGLGGHIISDGGCTCPGDVSKAFGMMLFCVTLLILFSFMKFQSEGLQVVGPEAPLDAVAGEDLVLPCFIKPNTSAVDMTVEWMRLEDVASLVHLYKDHEDRNEKQAQSYRGRTSLFKEELQKGNASLKLSALRVSDEGKYKCLVEDKSWYDDITVHVTVEVLGSHPVITMESYDHSGGINLVCESRGWNPEPEVLWMNREGDTLPAGDTQIHRDTEGFSVKHRITVYDYSDSNKFYCRLLQKHHMMEAEVIINSKVFDAWKWVVGISVSACLIVVGWIVTAVICYKKASELQKEKEYAASELQREKRYAASELQREKRYAELQRQRVEDELLKKKLFAVDVTLDPDTAHPYLILSADGKQVTHGDTRQDLPDTPQRFTTYPDVLGKQSFSSGRFYYEVQVRGKTDWTLGVVRENINRKGITLRPQNGFWTVELRIENCYVAFADPAVVLTLREKVEKVEKVGVFVDYEEGLVSFYDVKSSSHIYSFTGQSFTEKLYPFFSPGYNAEGENSAPLIISPVFNTE